jgi:hypothetical protein
MHSLLKIAELCHSEIGNAVNSSKESHPVEINFIH